MEKEEKAISHADHNNILNNQPKVQRKPLNMNKNILALNSSEAFYVNRQYQNKHNGMNGNKMGRTMDRKPYKYATQHTQSRFKNINNTDVVRRNPTNKPDENNILFDISSK